jgi:hypothetical protein
MFLESLRAERPELDVGGATWLWDRLSRPAALREVFVDAGAPPPAIVQETVVHPLDPDEFWTVVLGSGYRVLVDAIGPAAGERVRAGLRRRMVRARVEHVSADLLYGRARKT